MARTSVILQAETNRAPYVAQGTLAVLAVACVAGVAFGLATGGRGTVQRTEADLARAEEAMLNALSSRTIGAAPSPAPAPPFPQAPPSSYPAVSAPAPSPALAPTLAPTPPPTMLVPESSNPGVPAFRSPTPSIPPPSSPVPAKSSSSRPALPLGKQLKNPQAMEQVLAARALREQQDMQAAMELLRSADLREPDHPEILGEIALTYEAMGLQPKAESYWRHIYSLGEASAGGYYTLAASKIGSSATTPAAAPAPSAAISASPVSLGTCQLLREPLAKTGERIVLQVPLLANPGARIDPTKLEIRVTFYESINNGERLEPVPMEKTTQNWASLPTNWADPKGEVSEVSYNHFAQIPGSTDMRSFHGYAVKLYYQDNLVGEQAQPEALSNGAQKRTTAPGLDNALFPK